MLGSRHPAIQATGLLTLTPAGLSPAEHASLRWTHNRGVRLAEEERQLRRIDEGGLAEVVEQRFAIEYCLRRQLLDYLVAKKMRPT